MCRFGDWNVKEVDFLNRVQLISSKPAVYLVNLPEKAYIKKKSKWLPKVPQPSAVGVSFSWQTSMSCNLRDNGLCSLAAVTPPASVKLASSS